MAARDQEVELKRLRLATAVHLALWSTLPKASFANPSDLLGGGITGTIGSGTTTTDGAWSPTPPPATATSPTTVNPNVGYVAESEPRIVQRELAFYGFLYGQTNGMMGGQTQLAISSFQQFMGYGPTGTLTEHQRKVLADSYIKARDAGMAGVDSGGDIASVQEQLIASRNNRTGSAAPLQAGSSANSQVGGNSTQTGDDYDVVSRSLQRLQTQLDLLKRLLTSERAMPENPDRDTIVDTILAEIESDTQSQHALEDTAKAFGSPPNLASIAAATALTSSQTFPDLPYDIPGSTEMGEMRVSPTVTADGVSTYTLTLTAPFAENNKVSDTVVMDFLETQEASSALKAIGTWSDAAQTARSHEYAVKIAFCFPKDQCSEHRPGRVTTEFDYVTYADDSSTAKVRLNKGTVASEYYLSIRSARLLAAYLDYMTFGQNIFGGSSLPTDNSSAVSK